MKIIDKTKYIAGLSFVKGSKIFTIPKKIVKNGLTINYFEKKIAILSDEKMKEVNKAIKHHLNLWD